MPNYISLSKAQKALTTAQRVLVIGCSGTGKTTLALALSERFDFPYQSIDRDVRWLAGWQVRDRDAQRHLLRALVAEPRWVMDGSGASTFDIRVPRADLIIWLRLPRWMALLGVARRVLANYGKVRIAMAEGCPEPLPDRAFLSYIWHFERKSAPQFIAQIDRFGPDTPVVLVRARRHAQALLN